MTASWHLWFALSTVIAGGLALRRRSRDAQRFANETKEAAAVTTAVADKNNDNDIGCEVEIVHCVKCRWYLRAGWLAQELFATFGDDLGSVRLTPGPAGDFKVLAWAAGEITPVVVWDRRRDNGFPDPKNLKAAVRDAVMPGRALGKCIDKSGVPSSGGKCAAK